MSDTTTTPIDDEAIADVIPAEPDASASDAAPVAPPGPGLSLRLGILGLEHAKAQIFDLINNAMAMDPALLEDCLDAAKSQSAKAQLMPDAPDFEALIDLLDVEQRLYGALGKFKQQLKEINERAMARQALRGAPGGQG